MKPTAKTEYALRLARYQREWWKRKLNVQLPYRIQLRRLSPGFVLEVGCGIGRNLDHLSGNGVGVDHNQLAVDITKDRGFEAYLPDAFEHEYAAKQSTFDSLLLSHVAEHLPLDESIKLLKHYLKWVKPDGRVIIITPCLRGYHSDASHVTFLGTRELEYLYKNAGLMMSRCFCFPFPEWVGVLFKYNEYVSTGERRPLSDSFSPWAGK